MPSAPEQSGANHPAQQWGERWALQWRDLSTRSADWDDACRLGGNPFHCRAYLTAHCGRGERPVGIVESDSGHPIIGGVLSRNPDAFRSYSFTAPHGATGSGLMVAEWLRREDCPRFRLGSFMQGLEGQEVPPGVATEQRVEFEHDLGRPEEQWWADLHSQHRRKLRRSAKQGFILKKIPDSHASVMARLALSWSRRRGLNRSWIDLLRAWRANRKLLLPLSREGLGVLYGLYRRDGALLSAAYMLETHATAFYMLGASTETGYRAGASFELFWQLGRHYREGGLARLNLGGVPKAAEHKSHPEHGVYRFKRGFGIEPCPRMTWIADGG